jgi:hypothetical protein
MIWIDPAGRPGGPTNLTEVVAMVAKQRDRIVIDSDKAGQPAREGEILEVIEASYGTRYRVAWDDGHESTIRPAGGMARIVHVKPKAPTPR